MSDYLSPKKAHVRLGVSRTLFDKSFRPKLKEYRFGVRSIRYHVDELDSVAGIPETLINDPAQVTLASLQDSTRPFARDSGVYFLFADLELLYIGQSWHVPGRLAEHLPGVHQNPKHAWNRFAIFRAPPEQLRALEKIFLQRFRPRCNRVFG